MARKKEWEVIHHGPIDWKGGGPSEKKHYSRHATLEEANTHARKLAHASVPKGMHVEHNNFAAEDDPMHEYRHVGDKKLGDAVYAQKVGSQDKWEKDVQEGRAEPDYEEMLNAFANAYAFHKKAN